MIIAPTPESARPVKSGSGGADRVFGLALLSAGLAVLAIMGGTGLFLLYRGSDALADAGLGFLTTQQWEPAAHNFGIAALLPLTVLIAAVAVILAVPLATGVALYISEYAPRRLRRGLINLVDLMAAVPGVVFGLWSSRRCSRCSRRSCAAARTRWRCSRTGTQRPARSSSRPCSPPG
ncbi:MAG: hypothetical protein ACRDSR_10730 [Pseudonocardiaceae bacterium]